MSICFCASGCANNPLADPGAFGTGCSCWCHTTGSSRDSRQGEADRPARTNRDSRSR